MEQVMLLGLFNIVSTCVLLNFSFISETVVTWAAKVLEGCPRVGTVVAAAVMQMVIYAMVAAITWLTRDRCPYQGPVPMETDEGCRFVYYDTTIEEDDSLDCWPWTGIYGDDDPWVRDLERDNWNLRAHNTQLKTAVRRWTADNTWLCGMEDKLTKLVARQGDENQALVKKNRQLEQDNKVLKQKLSDKTDHVNSLTYLFDVDINEMFKSLCRHEANATKHEAEAKSTFKTIAEMSTALASVIVEVVASHGDDSLKAIMANGQTMAQLVQLYNLPVYGPRTQATADIYARPCSPSTPCPATLAGPAVSPADSVVMSPAAYTSLPTKPDTHINPAAAGVKAVKRSPSAASAHSWSPRP